MSAQALGAATLAVETQRLEHLLRFARPLARSTWCAPPVREFFAHLALLHETLVELPERLGAADDDDVVRLLRRHGADLDRALYSAPWQTIEAGYAAAVAHDPKLAWLAAVLPPYLEQKRREAREALRGRGIQRIAPSPGSPLDPYEVVACARAPRPTGQASLDGRVAGVQPGEGGWKLHGAVVRQAHAEVYAAMPAAGGQGQAAG